MIETKRLLILPLNYDQLIKYIAADNSLEEELNLNETNRTMSPELKEALEQTILPGVIDVSKNYLFSTLWTIISRERNAMVGDLCLINGEAESGEIEIGYGTYEQFRGNGYMSEALGGMTIWLQKQKIFSKLIANTEKSNVASFKVLLKNKFVKSGETTSLFNWNLSLQ